MSESPLQSQGRYVILRHEGSAEFKPGVHWDLMLEAGSMLRTWALAKLPGEVSDAERETGQEIAAEQLPDHRLAYLSYEGQISGNRGTVERCDSGKYELISGHADELVFLLEGQLFNGRVTMRRGANGAIWRCTCSRG